MRRKTLKMRKRVKRGGFSPFKKIKKILTRKHKTPPPSPVKENPLKQFFSRYEYNTQPDNTGSYIAYIPNVKCVVVFNEDQIVSIVQGSPSNNGGIDIKKILYSYDTENEEAQKIVKSFNNMNILTTSKFENGLNELINNSSRYR